MKLRRSACLFQLGPQRVHRNYHSRPPGKRRVSFTLPARRKRLDMSDRPVRLFPEGQPRPRVGVCCHLADLNQLADRPAERSCPLVHGHQEDRVSRARQEPSRATAAHSRSSAASPRSRKKSSPATSACSLTRQSAKSVLRILIRSWTNARTGPVAEIHVGSARPCSPELLSCGYGAVRCGPDRQASASAVDSTLSDHGSHGERAHSRPIDRQTGRRGGHLVLRRTGRSVCRAWHGPVVGRLFSACRAVA
jgi:hypothetical protein